MTGIDSKCLVIEITKTCNKVKQFALNDINKTNDDLTVYQQLSRMGTDTNVAKKNYLEELEKIFYISRVVMLIERIRFHKF